MAKPKQDRRYKQSNIKDIKEYQDEPLSPIDMDMEINEEKLSMGGPNGSSTIYTKTFKIKGPRSVDYEAEKLNDESSKRKFSSPQELGKKTNFQENQDQQQNSYRSH